MTEFERENMKAKIQGIIMNSSQKNIIGWAVEEDIGWAVEEDDFEAVAEEIVKNCFIQLERENENLRKLCRKFEHENEDLRSLLDKASQALACFVDLRGMTATELKSVHNGICILLDATKMLDTIKAEVGRGTKNGKKAKARAGYIRSLNT